MLLYNMIFYEFRTKIYWNEIKFSSGIYADIVSSLTHCKKKFHIFESSQKMQRSGSAWCINKEMVAESWLIPFDSQKALVNRKINSLAEHS